MALTYSPDPDLGKACPDFNLPGVDGKNYSLQNFLGSPAFLVMFICNHCPYVIAIEDRLVQLGQDLKKLNVPLVAISSNYAEKYVEDSFEKMKLKSAEKKYPFAYLYDESQEVAKNFGAVCTPDFFLYDQSLKLTYRGRLDDSWKDPSKVTQRELYQAVLETTAQKKISMSQTPTMGCNIKWK